MTIAGRASPRVLTIQAVVARYYRLPPRTLVSSTRGRPIARARQVAMYLCRELTGLSFARISHAFERDHTTVLYAYDRVRERVAEDEEFAKELAILTERVRHLAEADAVHPPCSCSSCSAGRESFPLDPPQLHLPIAYPGELSLQAAA